MRPTASQSQSSAKRRPLEDVTSRVNTGYKATPSRKASTKIPTSSPQLPHHESHFANGNLLKVPAASSTTTEDKRTSALAIDSEIDPNRLSQISWSTNNSGTSKKRKTHIGPWQLGTTLGKGACGRVRKARHAVTNQEAAIKIVSRRSAIESRSRSVVMMDTRFAKAPPRPDQLKRIPFGIDREIVTLKVIEHPNIIKVFDIWENRGEMYLVLELVEGGELFDYICRHHVLPEHEAVRLLRQIVSGLGHCHRFLLCHRDIKPENILLDKNNNVKIADFGMAAMQPPGSWLVTSCGSPHYAAPEVAQGHRYKGDKADVWSAGIVFYVMLVGTTPFGPNCHVTNDRRGQDDLQQLVHEILYEDPPFPDFLSDEAVDLLCRMLNKDPNHRISFDEIWEHPLFTSYEDWAQHPDYSSSWIGGPPRPLSSEDCGPQISDRKDLDMDIVDNVCTLYQNPDQETVINDLLSPNRNYVQLFYHHLLKQRTEQEENFQGFGIGVSGSDYHHMRRRPPQRSMTRSSLLGPGQKRSRSQFSIVESVRRPSTQQSRRAVSDAGTDKSYDPFRPSRHRFTNPDAEFAKITVLGRGSSPGFNLNRMSSASNSLRNPAIARVQGSEGSLLSSSPAPTLPMDAGGQIRELRRLRPPRCSTRSSWATTINSRVSSMAYRRSASYKRTVSFNHSRRRSSARESLPPRPNAPSPVNMHERYKRDMGTISSDAGNSNYRMTPDIPSSPPIRSRKEALTVVNADEPTPKRPKRMSTLLKDEARQVSMELERACQTAFYDKESDISASTKGFKPPTSQNALSQKPVVGNGTTANSRKFSSIAASKQRPLPLPPVSESLASQELRELEKGKQAIVKQAAELSDGTLDQVIIQIDRLIIEKLYELPEHERRARIVSAPESRSNVNPWLSPVKEEDSVTALPSKFKLNERTSSRRHISDPSHHNRGKSTVYRSWDKDASIRVVNDVDVPKPLVVRKKASGASLQTGPEPSLHTKRSMDTFFNISKKKSLDSLGLNKKRSNDTLVSIGQGKTGILSSYLAGEHLSYGNYDDGYLEPIQEEDKENRDPRKEKRDSRDSKKSEKKSWFRRSAGSQHSTESFPGPPPPPPPKELWEALPSMTQRAPTPQVRAGSALDHGSDDFVFRPGAKEKVATKNKFLKFFSKKDPKEKSYSDLYILDDDMESIAPSSILRTGYINGSSVSVANARNVQFEESQRWRGGAHQEPQNWFARFLHVKPAQTILVFNMEKTKAYRQIRGIFKDWDCYGMREVSSDRIGGKLRARVDTHNTLQIRPVSLYVDVHSVQNGKSRSPITVARILQEQGAKSSFEKVVATLSGVLRGRGHLITDKQTTKAVKKCFNEWMNYA